MWEAGDTCFDDGRGFLTAGLTIVFWVRVESFELHSGFLQIVIMARVSLRMQLGIPADV